MASQISITSQDVLLPIGLQADFMTGGALVVDGGDEIVPLVNRLASRQGDARGNRYSAFVEADCRTTTGLDATPESAHDRIQRGATHLDGELSKGGHRVNRAHSKGTRG
jgi:hypothetical protein